VIAIVALGGCDFALSTSAADEGDAPSDPDGADQIQCSIDIDCTLVASSCCGCPTFAAPVGFGGSCDDVECPEVVDCAEALAVCDVGQCTLVCSPVETTQVCDGGFVVDEAGCTLDMCEAPLAPECELNGDCVVEPADCCGCDLGGNDTAVPLAGLGEHRASLMCDGNVSCPGVSTCDESGRAECLGGRCRYLTGSETDEGPALCGTTETPTCPAGEVCVLNAPETGDGDAIPGIGTCQPL